MTERAYDPRLKVAIREIRNILDRHSIGGAITLASETHGEVYMHFPKWSLVQTDGQQVKVRLKGKEPERSEASLGLLLCLRDGVCAHGESLYHVCSEVLKSTEENGIKVDHTPMHNFTADTWE